MNVMIKSPEINDLGAFLIGLYANFTEHVYLI